MKLYTITLRLMIPALLAFVLSAQPLSAQNSLGFAPNVLSGWPDTTDVGDTILVAGILKNYSLTDSFGTADLLYFQGTVDTGSGPIPFLVPYPMQVIMSPQDTAWVFISFVFDTSFVGAPQFHVGNNVVVVWPIGVGPGNFDAEDSLVLNVYLRDLSGIGPEPPGGFLRIYPVPANGPLYINSFHPMYHITWCVIRDAYGREVYHGVPSGAIDTEMWAPGLYTIEAGLSNGTVSWYKIMRQ